LLSCFSLPALYIGKSKSYSIKKLLKKKIIHETATSGFHIFLDANFVLIHNHQLALGVNEKNIENEIKQCEKKVFN